ncbi:LysR family transcriptional regulator [uncultured Lactobacillus sp.]|uniref:LysR family transcriptional regulator n=1 Tax=uncultured Lactobacillus sp. TaxID=153152 RepID=UPI0025E3DA61|nr:LysR family transcriptional regulator [uncultured Lactobacillus sp.]
MNFTQLRCFIKAVDNSSFTIAAEAMNFTQPAVSKNIKDLENELDVTLINRGHHRISLTDAGRYFYKVARNVVNDMDSAAGYLRGQKNKIGGLLRIGSCNIPLEEELFPLALRLLHAIDHNLEVQFVNVLNNSISEVLNHHVDICLVSRDSIDVVKDIQFESLIKGKFMVACPKRSQLSKKSLVSISDLKEQKIFLFDPTNSLSFQTQNKLIASLGANHIQFVRDFFKMEIYVKAGWGYGVLPNFIQDIYTKDVKYVPLQYPPIPPYGIAYLKSAENDVDIAEINNVFKKAISSLFET